MAKIVIVFDSLRGNTKRVVDTMSELFTGAGHEVNALKPKEVEVADIEAADFLLLGGPTYHKDLINTMKQVMFKFEKADLEGKPGAAFASFGWSGESLGIIEETMKNLYKMDLKVDGIKIKQTPVVAKIKKEAEPFVQKILAVL
ncbi:MAG: flavodoxin domain-containing protein [Deltaproteobacteria bacterium]|nr:flavodoxin domain-containing protein [Deltaproteobacteria bacterium]